LDHLEHSPLPEPEPAISPDDTQPRAPATPPASLTESEPPLTSDDTHPRPAITTLDRAEAVPSTAEEEQPASGCGSPLLIGAVALAFLCLFVTSVGLAGYAGWRDGVQSAQTRKAATVVAYAGEQATLARQDCDEGRYELCNERCAYIATQQPGFPGMEACMSLAQIALSATPTPTTTITSAPPTTTPGSTTAASTDSAGGFTAEELYARALEAFRRPDYEEAMKWLEALRGLNADFHRKEVEDMLVATYQALGGQYQFEGRLSEMIVVIKKALQIRPLPNTDWEFTINAAELYLSAKGYLDAGNYDLADKVFIRLMDTAPSYLDSKTLACTAFASANDGASLKKYGC
jgi:tetratricopeptide (TPR) repeat protein